jgi:uncharacterized protein YdhG (YjbR/CyaY superfamily)
VIAPINPAKEGAAMAPTKPVTKSKQPATKPAGATAKAKGFTDEEKAAIREYARERKAQAANADGETELLAAIAKMLPADRAIAKKVHSLVKAAAPTLTSRTWYGMPAYAKDGSVVCFFQNAGKFKARYQTLGFTDKAKLDDGVMWPNSYAITKLTAAEEANITSLVKKAVG